MAPQYYHIACLLWLTFQVPLIMADEETNITSEFYCEADKKYIDDLKICNFIEDCSDGQDEARCGACRWTSDEQATETTICGLQILHSPASEVQFGHVVVGLEKELAKMQRGKPINSVLIKPSNEFISVIKHNKYLDLSGNNYLAAVYQINIEFPRLRPTDNEDCQLSVWLHPSFTPDLPPIGNVTEQLTNWPRVSVYVIEPNKVELVEQNVIGQQTKWFEFRTRIGQRLSHFWQPLIKFHTKVDTSTIYLGPISYRNCEPKNLTMLESVHKKPATSIGWDQELEAKCNQNNKFLCKLTGECIDRKFVCDFGRDCGPNDDSDEADCSDYEGLCDFEGSNRCGWISTHDSWLWVDSRALSNQSSLDRRDRPKVDHTYQSDRWGGHYMLINNKLLQESSTAQLIGPRVQLKPGYEECRMRFWLSTPDNLTQLSSAYLVAGFEKVHSAEIFDAKQRGEAGWRRFDILLLKKGLERPPYYTIHISFTNLSKELEKFRQGDGYLALDDLSFAPGCELAYYEEEGDFCPHNQFKCSVAPPQTRQTYCVPRNRVCDFKPDCGIDPKSAIASDETGCPGECRLDAESASLADCGLELVDYTKTDGLDDLLNRTIWYNHALDVNLSKGLQFVSLYEQFESNRAVSPRDNTTLKVELDEATVIWPSFSQAHANCTLQLEYAFSPDARNIVVHLKMQRENIYDIYYSAIFPHSQPDKEAGSRHLLEIGLGEQSRQFRMDLTVQAESNITETFAGSFTLFWYKFVACQHAAGLLDVLKSPIIMKPGDDDDDDDDDFAEGFQPADANSKALSLKCPKGQFQCQWPILCLPESLRCDMQVDCQDSAMDEFDCAALGAKHYNFDSHNVGDTPTGWVNERAQLASAFWEVSKHKRWDRIDYNSGPPVDHSSSSTRGKFLSLRARRPKSDPDTIQALIYTPKMRMGPKCKRVVFYFYYWQGALRRKPNSFELRVYITRTFDAATDVRSELLYQLPPDELSERDRWQRVELRLPQVYVTTTNGTQTVADEQFRLAFFGRLHGIRLQGDLHNPKVQGRDRIFAIDDVAFNLDCRLVLAEPADSPDLKLSPHVFEESVQVEPMRRDEETRVYIGRPFLMLLVLAFIVVVAATFINNRRRTAYQRMAKSDPEQNEGLVMCQLSKESR